MEDDEEDFPVQHRPKRQRLHEPSDSDSAATSNESASGSSPNVSANGEQEKLDEEKPKSKYRIHIPRNGDLPTDTFYTQPPPRDSSPYRIETFHWRKPKKASPLPPDRPTSGLATKVTKATRNGNISAGNRSPTEEIRGRPVSKEKAQKSPLVDESSYEGYDDVLADLPSDAFSSPEMKPPGNINEPIEISSEFQYTQDDATFSQAYQGLRAPRSNLQQTTLFGKKAVAGPSSSQSTRKHNWPLANRDEPPTHHVLDADALETWVYPTNLGSIREYQYGIVSKGLYHNLLVALPTGLGKTFIAATIMLNWFRWTKEAQIVFVAPTRPLVSQQVKACFEVAGIPRAETVMLTGNTAPGIRAEEWRSKRVFFMTPQTLINDLKSGIADPKKLVLLVVDEAHRATGGYAYVEVVQFLKRFNTSFRVLALTATPGASVEGVQAVIDGLGISRIEIRTEESLDIRQYVHARKIDTVLFDYSDEMVMVMDLFAKTLQPLLSILNGMNAYWTKDPMQLSPFGCNQAMKQWMASDGRKANQGTKGMVMKIFSLLASLAHGTQLLKFHGIGPFFRKVLSFQNGVKTSKYEQQILQSEHFQTMMTRIRSWVSNADFVGHPKLEYLQRVAMNHFLDAGEGRGATDPSSTRIMVFAHYRYSAEEIARVLNRNNPMIRAHVFVGQASSKESEGMDQKTQFAVIQKFKDGIYNILVATSIGEEGLDIGEIDLIVCYDASASPIRMLQRMGRTGRKRAGNIVVSLMKGKEENDFIKAKDNYEKMQHEIAVGTRFAFHDESNRRIVPKGLQPVVDKRVVDIPPENTQAELPEPTKKSRAPKRPPKKFNMPDNVPTGFVKASRLDGSSTAESEPAAKRSPIRASEPSPVPLPPMDEVLLSAAELKILERTYLDVKGDTPQIVQVPKLDAFPDLQRSLRPVGRVGHGANTKRTVNMLKKMNEIDGIASDHKYERALHAQDRKAGIAQAERRAAFFNCSSDTPKNTASRQTASPEQRTAVQSDEEASEETLDIDSEEDQEKAHEVLGQLKMTSSAFSPPSRANARQPFYVSPSKNHAAESESGEEDLPDFGALMGKPKPTAAASVGHTKKGKEDGAPSRRTARRRIVDDSDDE